MNYLKSSKHYWEKLSQDDPMWAVLSWPDKHNNAWNESAFFDTGKKTVEQLFSLIKVIHPKLQANKALDFGCGLGRLTQALVPYFEKTVGVDIAPEMIRLANEHNQYPDLCKYVLNQQKNLSVFESAGFDIVLSVITLQHIRPDYGFSYLAEMCRLLKAHGLLVVHLPHSRVNQKLTIREAIKKILPKKIQYTYEAWRHHKLGDMPMYGYAKNDVIAFMKINNMRLIHVESSDESGIEWFSYLYCFIKT